MTVEELAKTLGISRGSAYKAIRTGQLKAIRVGNRLLVPRAPVERFLSGEVGQLGPVEKPDPQVRRPKKITPKHTKAPKA